MKFAAGVFLVATLLMAASAPAADPLVVHEWGTFTCLQDETGRAIGAINTDDEPVPAFVHRGALGGGWLTEFYPTAHCQMPQYSQAIDASGGLQASGLTPDTVGTLNWPVVTVGAGPHLPMTQDKVWTTPRQVSADCVSVGTMRC